MQDDGTSCFTFKCDQMFSQSKGMAHDFPRASKSDLQETIRRESGAHKASPAVTRQPSQSASSRGLPRTAPKSKTNRGSKDPTEVTYVVTTFTAKEKNAGTDANIEVLITGVLATGDKTNSRPLKLQKSLTNRDKFEKGKPDKFKFEDRRYCGRLTEIKLTSDNTRGYTGHKWDTQWLCDRVEVVEDRGGNNKETYTFTNSKKRWLSKDQGLSMTLKVNMVTPKPPRASKSDLQETIRRESGAHKASPAVTRQPSQSASSRGLPRTARKSKTNGDDDDDDDNDDDDNEAYVNPPRSGAGYISGPESESK